MKILSYLVTKGGSFPILRRYRPSKAWVLKLFGKLNFLCAQSWLCRFISRLTDQSLLSFRVLRQPVSNGVISASEPLVTWSNTWLTSRYYQSLFQENIAGVSGNTERAINSVLFQQGRVQKPIYYVNHLLKGVELRYTDLEKLIMMLIITAR